jgi:hypothetical protein
MKLGEMNNNYVFTTDIDLEDGNILKMRELTTGELNRLNKVKEEDRLTELAKLFPSCLVGHPFTKNDDDEEKASNEEVYQELKKSGSLFMDIISIWMEAIPLNERLKKKEKEEKEEEEQKKEQKKEEE